MDELEKLKQENSLLKLELRKSKSNYRRLFGLLYRWHFKKKD